MIFHTSSGLSLVSVPTFAFTLAAVDGLQATAVSDSVINVSWNSNASDATGFELQQSTDGGGTWTTLGMAGAGTTLYTVSGLTADQDYFFQLCAIRPGGNSQFTGPADAYTLPDAPSTLTAAANGTNEIDLSWPEDDPNVSGYDLQRSDVSVDDNGIDSSTVPGTTYYYQVMATNGTTRSAPSSVVSVAALVGSIQANDDTPDAGVSYSAADDQPLTLNAGALFANDQDPNNGQSMSIASFTQPAHGTLTNNGDGTFTYTANLGYTGMDSFTYTPTDQYGASSNAATVQIQALYTPPQAASQIVGCGSGASVTGSLLGASATGSVQGTTTNPDVAPLTFSIQTGPQDGTVSISGGQFTYTAGISFTGVDSFTYVANDGVQNSNLAKVSVIVEPGIVTFSGAIDGSDYLHIKGNQFWIVHRNYYPAGQYPGIPDHNLYVDGVPGNTDTVWTISPTLANATPVVAISDGRGDVTVTQQPSASNGYETIVLINDDPEFGPWWYDVAVMPASVTPPTVLQPASVDLSTQENQAISTPTYYLGNLVQLNSGTTPPAGLAVAQVTDGNPAASGRQLTLNADGNFTYTPPPNFVGRDWFTYKLTDSAGDASNYGTVFIDVTPVTDSLKLTIGNTSDPAPSSDPQDTPFVPIDDGYNSDSQSVPNDQLVVPDADDPALVPATLTTNTNAPFWATWTLNFPSNVRVFEDQGNALTPVTAGQPSAAVYLSQTTPISFLVQGLSANAAAPITALLTPVTDPNTHAAPPVTTPTTRSVTVNVAPKPLEVLSVNDNAPGTVLTPAQQQAGIFVPISNPAFDFHYQLPINIANLPARAALQIPQGWALIDGFTGLPAPLEANQVILLPGNPDVPPYYLEADVNSNAANVQVKVWLSQVNDKNQLQGRLGSLGSFSVTPFILSNVAPNTPTAKYTAAGPGDVPQFGKYEYNITPLKGGMSQWLDPVGGRMTIPTNNSNDVYIQWIPGADNAPFQGEAIFEANPQYIWQMPVNVMTITVTATNPFATTGGVTGAVGIATSGTAGAQANSYLTVQSDPITWNATIAVAEPDAPLHGGGVNQLRIGFVQNLQVQTFQANYGAVAPGAPFAATLPHSKQLVEGAFPYWDTADRNPLTTPQYPDSFYSVEKQAIFNPSETKQTSTISEGDRPEASFPRSYGVKGKVDLQSTAVLWNLGTFVAATTKEAPAVYAAQASAAWKFDGTGNFNAGNQKWTKTTAAITPPSNNQWVPSDENTMQPTTTGTRFNDVAEGGYGLTPV